MTMPQLLLLARVKRAPDKAPNNLEPEEQCVFKPLPYPSDFTLSILPINPRLMAMGRFESKSENQEKRVTNTPNERKGNFFCPLE